ncbi:MAG: anti-phage defense ZorAB system protein ZorA [Geminicoccaceae bacterium]|nr:anti-phage defense ZorAB system protein ZorA [Geminicoccaceae bacterium]
MWHRSAIEVMMMDWLPALNFLVSRWETIAAVCLVLLVWSVVSGARLWLAGRSIRTALRRASDRLEAEPARPLESDRFEAVRRDLAETRLIGPLWRAWAETVVVPVEPRQPVRATLRPETLFDLGLYRRVGSDLRYHTALPGLLVGAGLLFTFFGLAIALANAGAIVTAADSSARSTGLKGLLDAASIKFVTSLVGLLCSILYALHRKRSLKKTERALDRFCALVEERFPLATPAFFQAKANGTLAQQSRSLETLANDLAQSLGPALDRALDARLGEHIGPLREAIERLAAREAADVGRTLEAMLDRFLEKLGATSSAQLDGVAARLDEAARGLEGLRAGLDGAASRLSDAAAELSANLAKGSQAAADELARRVHELSEQLALVVRQQSEGARAGLEALTVEIPRIVEAMHAASANAGKLVEESGARAGEALGTKAREAAAMLASSADRLGERLGAAAGRLESAADRTFGGAEQLARASGGLGTRLDGLAAALSRGAEAVQSSADQAARALQAAAQRAAQDLHAAAAPFTAATRSLAASAEALQRTNERIDGMGRALQEAVSGLTTIGRGLVEGARQLQQVAGQFEATSQRFAGLDESLGATLEELATQYEAFAQRIGVVVAEVDGNLAKAVNGLQSLVSDLTEAIQDLQPARPNIPRR